MSGEVLQFTGKQVRPIQSRFTLKTLVDWTKDIDDKSVQRDPRMDLDFAQQLDAVASELRRLAVEAKRLSRTRAQLEIVTYASRIEDIAAHIELEHHHEAE